MVRPRRRWLRLALVLLPVAVAGLLLALGGALTCRPAWYQPASIDYGRLQDDKRTQLRLENQISAALNGNSPIDIELDETQVNRWIAARHELWPTEAPSLEPFSRPQVVLLNKNRLRLAGLVEQSGLVVLLSTTLGIELRDDKLVVSWNAIHAGALPAPRKLVQRVLHKLFDSLDSADEVLSSRALAFPNEWVWPNGKRRFRIADVSIGDGVARVRLEPF